MPHRFTQNFNKNNHLSHLDDQLMWKSYLRYLQVEAPIKPMSFKEYCDYKDREANRLIMNSVKEAKG